MGVSISLAFTMFTGVLVRCPGSGRHGQAWAGRPLPICDLSQFFPANDGGIKSTFHRGLKGDMRNGELAALVGPSVPDTHRYLGFLSCGILCAELTLSTLFTIMRIKGGPESV